ncbi:GNAT family N-acetyltransferase [Deinococcus pimensis]|uniref:GNAT family N-acetyltransferase n=1 Tax=Deinococcus pimensis TaxID=309888 RepID=UPI00316AC436
MTTIANEPVMYDASYRRHLHGLPVTKEQAERFLRWASDTWRGTTQFAFLLLDPFEALAGFIFIKSRDPEGAEIGYWLSAGHAGVMTNAVLALAEAAGEAGFQALWARVQEGNVRSEAVLLRAGFTPLGVAPDPEKGHALFSRYHLALTATNEASQPSRVRRRAERPEKVEP